MVRMQIIVANNQLITVHNASMVVNTSDAADTGYCGGCTCPDPLIKWLITRR